jgi:DHA1 family bicyclomycin/chloramphenicol resistance-like MFS transporter
LSYVVVVLSVTPLVAPALGSAVLPFAGWHGIYLIQAAASTLIALMVAFGFAETLAANRKQSLQPVQLLARYRRVVTHGRSLGFGLVNGLIFACMFAFISGSPLVLIDGRGFSPAAFAAVFACAGCGTIGGAFINGQLAKRGLTSAQILPWTLLLAAASTLTLLTLSLTGYDSVPAMLPLLVASNATYGLVGPNASHEALLPMPQAAGIASAVLRAIQMVAGASASALVPFLYHGKGSVAMTSVMAGCAVSAGLIYAVGLRRPAGVADTVAAIGAAE